MITTLALLVVASRGSGCQPESVAGILPTDHGLGAHAAQGYDPSNYKDLQWVNVGPNRGGRSVACTGVRTRPSEYYFGATGGGLWKSTDAGATWACVTDG